MERKQTKWIIFYIFMLCLFLFLILLVNGVFSKAFPNLSLPISSVKITAAKIQALCEIKRFDTIAKISLKDTDGRLVRITDADILKSNLESGKGDTALAIALCKSFSSVRKVDKVKVSDSEWTYTFRYGLFHDVGRTYRVIFFDDDWRFVLNQ